jgi:hypothetical protein
VSADSSGGYGGRRLQCSAASGRCGGDGQQAREAADWQRQQRRNRSRGSDGCGSCGGNGQQGGGRGSSSRMASVVGRRRWPRGGCGGGCGGDRLLRKPLAPWFDPRSHCLGVVGPQPGSRGNPANPGVITGNRMPQLRTLSGRLIGGDLNRGSRWVRTILLDISAHGRKVGMLSQGWLPSAEHFCWRWVGMGLKQTKKVDGHLVRKNKEPGWMATSSARTKSQSNRLTRRRCPCPSISIDNVPALRVYPSRSLEALGRLFRAKVILGRPRLG